MLVAFIDSLSGKLKKVMRPVFDDEVFTLNGSRLYSTPGKVDYDWAEGAVIFEPSGNINLADDLVSCDGQYKHAGKEAGKIYPHLHWWQPDNRLYIWTMKYRINANGQPKTTDWITVTAKAMTADDVFPYVSGTMNQITFFGGGLGAEASGIQLPANSLSCVIQFRFTRTDALTGNVLGTSFDYHYLRDTNGSVTQGRKY